MKHIRRTILALLLAGAAITAGALTGRPAGAQDQQIGVNVVLNTPPTAPVLADLGAYGTVLDVIPQIRGVTLRADASKLPAIRALSSVRAAQPDAKVVLAQTGAGATPAGFANGANHWALDAIDVTDYGGGRTAGYTGAGVYVAVLDTGLVRNWREYLPEERIATQFARGFAGGGGERGAVSSVPAFWEHDTQGHGTAVTSILLGFRYLFAQPALPVVFNGVAPGATVIPVKLSTNNDTGSFWLSAAVRGIIYVADLQADAALAATPLP